MRFIIPLITVIILLRADAAGQEKLLIDRVEHHNVDSGGVNIHYVTVGEGPILLFVHGFPDFWYVWHNQMEALSDSYQCVAMDTRASNKSGRPKGVENYDMKYLLADIDAIIEDLGADELTLVAHDWGGIIAWYYTMNGQYKSKVRRLVMMNLTHPRGFSRTLANATPEQRRNTEYARNFQQPGSEDIFEPRREAMAGRYADQGERVLAFAKQAYQRADFEGMLNFYRANYFKEPYVELTDLPMVECPVLQFHGLRDRAVDKDGLSKTWDWIAEDYTLLTFPGVGHTVQREAAEKVTETMRWWLSTH